MRSWKSYEEVLEREVRWGGGGSKLRLAKVRARSGVMQPSRWTWSSALGRAWMNDSVEEDMVGGYMNMTEWSSKGVNVVYR